MILSSALHIVQRDEWLARSPDRTLVVVELKLPIPYVIFHRTASPQCTDTTQCIKFLIGIQNYHMSINYGDIGYNFLIGADGYVYVGRNWEYMGAHTYPYNRCTIAIAFIGSFDQDKPMENQIDALNLFLSVAVKTGKIRKDCRLYSAGIVGISTYPNYSVKLSYH